MIFRINFLTPILTLPFLFPPTFSSAQKSKKADKPVLANLETHVRYLTDLRLEDRPMGSAGEKLASDYIISELSKIGLRPMGDNNGWLQTFDIDQGREVGSDAFFMVNDRALVLGKEYFPLALSAVGSVSGSPAIALQESGVPWFQDLKELLEAGGGNPHFDLRGAIRARVASCAKKGATALILYNSGRLADNLSYDPHEKGEPVSIPVVYVTKEAKRKYLKDDEASVDLKLKVSFVGKKRTGHNIVGFLDNGASSTVVIAAHYDHDSVESHGKPWENNVSGIAEMIELARMLAVSKLKSNNYLFVAFSGEEMGAFGSKYMAAHLPSDAKQLNYMLDLDKYDPMSDSTHRLIVGGYGTSPSWWGICREVKDQKDLSLRLDSAYRGGGDHMSFYNTDLPVLVFYSGPNVNDYAGELMIVKFIYDVVAGANARGRLAFTKVGS